MVNVVAIEMLVTRQWMVTGNVDLREDMNMDRLELTLRIIEADLEKQELCDAEIRRRYAPLLPESQGKEIDRESGKNILTFNI